MKQAERWIEIRGARQHNLADIDLRIPRERLIVLTGVSGSGKSSLAFDTIYADAQRRFLESLSAHARQFLEQAARPDVDSIEGLCPAIAIAQGGASSNPRSTVGTSTELLDYLRVLYARFGVPYCDDCGTIIRRHSPQSIANFVQQLPEKTRVQLLAPAVEQDGDADAGAVLARLRRAGFVRVRIAGRIYSLDEEITDVPGAGEPIDIVVDRLVVKPALGSRLTDSIELCLRESNGRVQVLWEQGDGASGEERFNERYLCESCGLRLPEVQPRLFSFNSPFGACPACGGLGRTDGAPCPECAGARLCREARLFRVENLTLPELTSLSAAEAASETSAWRLSGAERDAAEPLLFEIRRRLQFLEEIGLGYLSLDRAMMEVSSGERQRIRLATQLGAGLSGVLYVVDEPTIGLHQSDTVRLLCALERLKELGNSVLVVEHDLQVIRAADHVVDLGPGAGEQGGRIVAQGSPEEVAANPGSATGRFLSGTRRLYRPAKRRARGSQHLQLCGAALHNLKLIDVEIPLGLLVCVTGVSGSGKSSLISDTLYPALRAKLEKNAPKADAPFKSLSGEHYLDSLLIIDQAPIGTSSRSTPATYSGVHDALRSLFANIPEARARGYGPSRFSFNVKGGRCEHCQGLGAIRVEMQFLPDVYVLCPECGGARYNRDTLDIRFKGMTIADVLELSVDEAMERFAAIPPLAPKLKLLHEVGLGYLRLGQSSDTLSGGEAQRIKLAAELARRKRGRTLYLLDEPTSGLHPADIDALLLILHRLVEEGNSVLIIEHNLDVAAGADWCIDLGPEGGRAGGRLVAAGTPEQIASCPESRTGACLRDVLKS